MRGVTTACCGCVAREYEPEVGVEVSDTLAETLHILCEELIRVGDAVVNVGDLVVGVALQVRLHQVLRQVGAEAQVQLCQAGKLKGRGVSVMMRLQRCSRLVWVACSSYLYLSALLTQAMGKR